MGGFALAERTTVSTVMATPKIKPTPDEAVSAVARLHECGVTHPERDEIADELSCKCHELDPCLQRAVVEGRLQFDERSGYERRYWLPSRSAPHAAT
jgi:hypothetical protein